MKKKNDEVFLIPLNKNLYNEFSLDELEQRMETDPIAVGIELLGLDNCPGNSCSGNGNCDDLTMCIGNTTCSENHSCTNNGVCAANTICNTRGR